LRYLSETNPAGPPPMTNAEVYDGNGLVTMIVGGAMYGE